MNIEQERADFEVWAKGHYVLQRSAHNDTYIAVPTMRAWDVWQARAARQSQDRENALGMAMRDVADRYAHRLAMLLECILFDYSGKWYDEAATTLGEYRSAMNDIHENESPTYMGEPIIDSARRTEGEGK